MMFLNSNSNQHKFNSAARNVLNTPKNKAKATEEEIADEVEMTFGMITAGSHKFGGLHDECR